MTGRRLEEQRASRPAGLAGWPAAAAAALVAFAAVVWSCDGDEPLDPVDGDLDADTDADTDADGGEDAEPDAEPDADAEGEQPRPCRAEPGTCSEAADCLVAVNYRLCCPCPMAWSCATVEVDYCFVRSSEPAERPAGCGMECGAETCPACPEPDGVACVEGLCRTTYPGECRTAEDCGAGELCELAGGESRCVEDPNECGTDADCPDRHWCRDSGLGVLACWHEDSLCMRDLECDYNHFCEDPEGDGVYRCVDRAPACRVGFDESDCPVGSRCVDGDGDGRGECA